VSKSDFEHFPYFGHLNLFRISDFVLQIYKKMTRTEIQRHLAERGLRPLKQFGQNFLHDQNLCQWLVKQIVGEMKAGQPLLEIGPGLGALTEPLLEAGCDLTAIEKDRGLAEFLRQRFYDSKKFHLWEGDALEILPELTESFPVVAGNLPYNISTPLLMTLLERSTPPQRMVFTLQREVAQRLGSAPGRKDYGAVSVLVQAEYEVEILKNIPATVFYPEPEVGSSVVRLRRRGDPLIKSENRAVFHDLVKKGFSQRRKKLSNLLDVDDSRRAEELTIAEWVLLCRTAF
jgi:16S rRNA (adenine1518-N6/adenine1519-N6)-dimethyltransferase